MFVFLVDSAVNPDTISNLTWVSFIQYPHLEQQGTLKAEKAVVQNLLKKNQFRLFSQTISLGTFCSFILGDSQSLRGAIISCLWKTKVRSLLEFRDKEPDASLQNSFAALAIIVLLDTKSLFLFPWDHFFLLTNY